MRKGFTLIELVMVIVIIGILAVVALPRFFDLQGSANNAATQGALGALRSAAVMWYANQAAAGDASPWPATSAELQGAMADNTIPLNRTLNLRTVAAVIAGSGTPGATVNTSGWYMNESGGVWACNHTDW